MKTKEIWIVAYIYSIICFCIFFGMKEIESKKFNKQLYQAKSFAVEFHDEKESLYEAVESLNKHIDKMEHLDKLIEDLNRVPRESRKDVLANCYNESNLKYDVKHKSKFDKTTTGICGIKTVWIDIIPELNEDNINTLKGGEMVMNYLLVKHKGNKYEALKEYKGSINNLKPVHSVLELEKRLKESR